MSFMGSRTASEIPRHGTAWVVAEAGVVLAMPRCASTAVLAATRSSPEACR